jgi:hypothetical protein
MKKECHSPTCQMPILATRKDDPSIGYCIAHAMEYAQIMENSK